MAPYDATFRTPGLTTRSKKLGTKGIARNGARTLRTAGGTLGFKSKLPRYATDESHMRKAALCAGALWTQLWKRLECFSLFEVKHQGFPRRSSRLQFELASWHTPGTGGLFRKTKATRWGKTGRPWVSPLLKASFKDLKGS